MKVSYKPHVLLAILINLPISNIVLANDESIDAEFIEFLADMEEMTGSGFDLWLEDDGEDKKEYEIKEIDQNIKSNDHENQ